MLVKLARPYPRKEATVGVLEEILTYVVSRKLDY